MKGLFYILMMVMFFSCDKEDAWGCIQAAGSQETRILSVDTFDKILVNRDIELVVKQGQDYKVEIQTGQNLLNNIEITVVDKQLQLSDTNSCNFVRDFGLTKMIVTTPFLKEIRSSTQYLTSSEGVLNLDNLTLISENYNSNYLNVGDFNIKINAERLKVIANGLSVFTISGSTESLSVEFYAGLCEFKGADLIAQHVNIFQRSSHDIIVNPKQSLTVDIRSVGDVISVYRPHLVDVQEYYSGQLLFLD